jgi:hypothetical protein
MEDQEVELLIETHLQQTAQQAVGQEIHLPLVHLKDLMVEMQITLGVMLEAAVVVEQLLMDQVDVNQVMVALVQQLQLMVHLLQEQVEEVVLVVQPQVPLL